jgi:hypothetical protein
MRIIEEGQQDGEFTVFEDTDRVFTFFGSGRKWRQAEYRYHCHYAYMPRRVSSTATAVITSKGDGVNASVPAEQIW